MMVRHDHETTYWDLQHVHSRQHQCSTPGVGWGGVVQGWGGIPETRVPGGAIPSSSSLSYVPRFKPTVISRRGRSMTSCIRLPCFFSSALYDLHSMVTGDDTAGGGGGGGEEGGTMHTEHLYMHV